MTHTYADCRKAKRDLDYTPKYDLEKGLANEWEWIKQNRVNKNIFPYSH